MITVLSTNDGFTITQPIRKEEEPLCCPSEYEIDTYIWNGSSFIHQK